MRGKCFEPFSRKPRASARLRLATKRGIVVVALLVLPSIALAQPQLGNLLPSPRLLTLSPPGGQAGQTVEVAFTGTDTDEPQALLFNHPGLQATPIIPPPPKVDPKAKPDPNKKGPPGPPPITKFSVTIGDVPPGYYEVRLVGKYGVSNPRRFVIGDRPEVMEKEPNNDVEQAQRVDIGTIINGTIGQPTDVDYTVFAGKKGQRLLARCQCASIDSRLHPEMRLFDTGGRQLAYSRPTQGEDGLIEATLPADGDYYVRLCQFTYTAGTPEFFYRLSISEAPYLDAVFPPVIEPGKTAEVTLYGRNLPGGKPDPAAVVDGKVLDRLTVSITAPGDPLDRQRLQYSGIANPLMAGLDGFEYRLKSPKGQSDPVLFTYARAPVVLDNGNNDTPETAQSVPLPCEIAGRIEKLRDRDWYAFTAKKGEVWMIDVQSQRLGAPTDIYFRLINAENKQEITQQDDNPENFTPAFFTPNRDPAPFRFVVPADGKYLLLVASHIADTIADVRHVYRVRITPEQPDFRLVVMPADLYRPDALVLGQGGNDNYTVYALRQDGFKGDIALTLEGLPPGVQYQPQVIGPTQKYALLVLSAAPDAAPWTGSIKVKGTATIAGQTVIREARSASITWPVQAQSNIPTVTRLDHALMLAVRDRPPFVLALDKAKATVTQGDKVNVQVKVNFLWPDLKPLNIQLQQIQPELPQGVTFGNLTVPADKKEATLVLTVQQNVAPGNYNVVFRGFASIPFARDPKKKNNVNVVMPTPALALTVLPKQLAQLSVNNNNPTVKVGNQAELVVKVNRQFDYQEAFQVKLILPKEIQGLSADEATIAPGQNEVKLLLRVPPDAAPGNRQNVVIQAVAMFNGNVPILHEMKINVNVVK